MQRLTPTYKVTKVTGPDHNRRYEVELHLGDKVLGHGHGRSRKHAEQEAAEAGLARLSSEENDDHS